MTFHKWIYNSHHSHYLLHPSIWNNCLTSKLYMYLWSLAAGFGGDPICVCVWVPHCVQVSRWHKVVGFVALPWCNLYLQWCMHPTPLPPSMCILSPLPTCLLHLYFLLCLYCLLDLYLCPYMSPTATPQFYPLVATLPHMYTMNWWWW